MRRRWAMVMLPLHLIGGAGEGFAQGAPTNDVAVRLYDTTGVTPEVKAAALARAAGVLDDAVHVAWTDCNEHPDTAACALPPAGAFILRMVRAGAAGSPDDAPRVPLPLGDAHIDGMTGHGVLATVYVDRVETLAQQAGADPATLLGYTIAHELGHLLLGSVRHTPDGLMRPVWFTRELVRSDAATWGLSAGDISAIRARVRRQHPRGNIVWATR